MSILAGTCPGASLACFNFLRAYECRAGLLVAAMNLIFPKRIKTQLGAEIISAKNKIRNCFLITGIESRRPREKSSYSHCRLARIGRANKKSFVDLRDGAGGFTGAAVVFELRGGGRDNGAPRSAA